MTGSARLTAQRAAQGFPATVEDPIVLARLAAVVLGNGEGAAEAAPRNTSPLPISTGTTRSPDPDEGVDSDGTPDR